jgi:hypothetical protein
MGYRFGLTPWAIEIRGLRCAAGGKGNVVFAGSAFVGMPLDLNHHIEYCCSHWACLVRISGPQASVRLVNDEIDAVTHIGGEILLNRGAGHRRLCLLPNRAYSSSSTPPMPESSSKPPPV